MTKTKIDSDSNLKEKVLNLLNNNQTPGLTSRQIAEALGLGSNGKAIWKVSGILDQLKTDGIVNTALKTNTVSPLNHQVSYSHRFYLTENEAALEQQGVISPVRNISSMDALELFDDSRLKEFSRVRSTRNRSLFDLLGAFGTGSKPRK